MKLRLVKPEDADELADVYYACNEHNPRSFMSELGRRFIKEYYRIVLSAPSSIAIAAISVDNRIMGFASATLDANEQMAWLKKSRARLLLAALPRIACKPSLLRRMFARSQSANNAFIVTEGARWDYWAWNPIHKVAGGALVLQQCLLSFVSQLGGKTISIEVNVAEKGTVKLHELSGAQKLREIRTPEGLDRVIMEYSLSAKPARID